MSGRCSTASLVFEAKGLLRREMRAKRRACAPTDRAGRSLSEQFVAAVEAGCLPLASGMAVAAYMSCGAEADTSHVLTWLQLRGHSVLLPVVVVPGYPLLFRCWRTGDPLECWNGLYQPLPSACEMMPDFMIVPLLAFDRRGYRLGQGGGYYDLTLKHSKGVFALGFAYACQEAEVVPVNENDQKLSAVITEKGLIKFD